MSVNADSPRSGETTEPRLFGRGLDPREMQLRSAAAKRAKREQLAAGPREAIALGLTDSLTTLRAAARKLVEDAASDDATTRRAARRDMGTWLNQGLGTIERRSDVTASEGDTLPADRETRMRLLAELDALSED